VQSNAGRLGAAVAHTRLFKACAAVVSFFARAVRTAHNVCFYLLWASVSLFLCAALLATVAYHAATAVVRLITALAPYLRHASAASARLAVSLASSSVGAPASTRLLGAPLPLALPACWRCARR
jgi:hypothetical protein